MLGATQAAKRWARQQRKKDIAKGIAIGYARGFEQGRIEGRRALLAELRARAACNPEILKILDAVDADNPGQ